MDSDLLMSLEEVADTIGTSVVTVRRRIAEGQLAAIRLGDGPHAPIRVASSDLARFLRKGAERQREKAVR